jgi:hypothetical protein
MARTTKKEMLLERGTKFLLGIREFYGHVHTHPDEPMPDILNRFNGEVSDYFLSGKNCASKSQAVVLQREGNPSRFHGRFSS